MRKTKTAAPSLETESVPDRSRCPPDEEVRAFVTANGKVTKDESLEEHIRQCEWCAREYRDHASDLKWNQFITRSTKASYLVLIAIVIAIVLRSCH